MWNLKFRSGSKKTPRNLIAGTVSLEQTWPITLMFSARFWSLLLLSQKMLRFICLVLDLKNSINLVLSGCRTSLLTRKNSQIFRNSILAIAINSLIFVCVNSSVVSSANSKERNFEDKRRSLMYKINSEGPKIEPCGTPNVMFYSGLELLFIVKNCFRSVKYDLNHINSVSARPYFFSLSRRIWWLQVSNAFFKSQKIAIVWLLLFNESLILFRKCTIGWIVEWPDLNPNCHLLTMLRIPFESR